jgi:hypothetical protein
MSIAITEFGGRRRRARKRHWCWSCRGLIRAGEVYVESYETASDLYHPTRLHEQCVGVWWEVAENDAAARSLVVREVAAAVAS